MNWDECERYTEIVLTSQRQLAADLLLHFCHMFRGHASLGPQGVGHVAVEQQPELCHLQHDQPHQLTLVHPTDHLLEAARNTQKWYNRVGSRSTEYYHGVFGFSARSAFLYMCFPWLLEAASMSLSNSVM